MAYNFPNSPSVGTVFNPVAGVSWQWNGTAWMNVSPSGLIPEAPTDGQNYVRRNGTWVVAPGTAEAKNRIVNPCFQIQQDAGMGSGFVVDQWFASTTIASATYQRGNDTTPFGSKYNIRFIHTTPKPSLAALDFHGFGQPIEGTRIADFQWGTAAARQVVLRFAVWSTVAGTFNVSISCGVPPITRSYVDTFTISAGEINTYAYKTLVIPGDVTGTWNTNNSTGLTIYISFALGSTYTTATRGWQAGEKYGLTSSTNGVATAATFYLYDVGLYLDPQNTGIAPPWTMPDEAQELLTCRRYWQTILTMFSGYTTSGNNQHAQFSYPVKPRIDVPAINMVNQGANFFATTGSPTVVSVDGGYDMRMANGTGQSGYFISTLIINARM